MNLYSNIAFFHLSEEDKFQPKGVTDQVLQTMFPKRDVVKIFHIDCPYTRKKVCYCKCHESVQIPNKEKEVVHALSEMLEMEYRGRGKKFQEAVFERRNFIKEKYKNLQELEDVQYYLGYYEDDKDPKKKAISGSVPTKKVQIDPALLAATKASTFGGNQFANEDIEFDRMEKRGRPMGSRSRNTRQKFDDEEPLCHYESCGKSTNPEDFLECRVCHRSYHAKCSTPPLSKNIVSRYNWECFECKTCHQCHSKGDDHKMLICDICDRAFHSDCLVPKLTTIPEGDWYCNDCTTCKSCKKSLTKEPNFPNLESNLFEEGGFFLCAACKDAFENVGYCPVCFGIIDEDDEGNYICCDKCEKWVHAECDNLNQKKLKVLSSTKYLCPNCRPIGTAADGSSTLAPTT